MYYVACSGTFKLSADFQCAAESRDIIAHLQVKNTRMLLLSHANFKFKLLKKFHVKSILSQTTQFHKKFKKKNQKITSTGKLLNSI